MSSVRALSISFPSPESLFLFFPRLEALIFCWSMLDALGFVDTLGFVDAEVVSFRFSLTSATDLKNINYV